MATRGRRCRSRRGAADCFNGLLRSIVLSLRDDQVARPRLKIGHSARPSVVGVVHSHQTETQRSRHRGPRMTAPRARPGCPPSSRSAAVRAQTFERCDVLRGRHRRERRCRQPAPTYQANVPQLCCEISNEVRDSSAPTACWKPFVVASWS